MNEFVEIERQEQHQRQTHQNKIYKINREHNKFQRYNTVSVFYAFKSAALSSTYTSH